jgi:hypothetical protein
MKKPFWVTDGPSGLAQWVVREAEHHRKWGPLGWASRSNLTFYAMIIISGHNTVWDGETPF